MRKVLNSIDVLIPVFNESDYIEECLSSVDLAARHTSARISVFISDNSSSDETVAIVNRFKSQNIVIRLIQRPKNLGAKNNWGLLLNEVESEYFMFLDGHDLISEDYFSAFTHFLERNRSHKLILMPDKVRLVHGNDNIQARVDTARYIFSSKSKLRFWQLLFYLQHCTEIHAFFPYELAKDDLLIRTETFHFDHTFLFYALSFMNLEYTESGSYLRRYWPSLDQNHSHFNSGGILETRFQRAIGSSDANLNDRYVFDEILPYYKEVLPRWQVPLARYFFNIKYTQNYSKHFGFRIARRLFGLKSTWRANRVN